MNAVSSLEMGIEGGGGGIPQIPKIAGIAKIEAMEARRTTDKRQVRVSGKIRKRDDW